jgi:hypothetical protein
MKERLILGVAFVLLLSALPVWAGPADQTPDPREAVLFAAPGAACARPVASKTEPTGIGQASVCIAHCWNGSTQTCTGTSCFAVDSSCPGERGYCWSNTEGTKYCPECQSCQGCTASCANAGGGTVSCTSCTGDYFCVNNCYAYCDGVYHWCPNPKPICPF